MESIDLALRCSELADKRKGEEIVILDVHELSSITDFFVIASGTSEPHLRAIVEEIEEGLVRDEGIRPKSRDGSVSASWVVLDYFDVIVHVMHPKVREQYDLEGLWSDAPKLQGVKA
jgi:ribosome-associated protein